jgi:hypothetical protein
MANVRSAHTNYQSIKLVITKLAAKCHLFPTGSNK